MINSTDTDNLTEAIRTEYERSGGGYEEAPATKMLDSKCCVCSRPLLDVLSVSIGMGPICREKHGYDAEIARLDEETRRAANTIVNHIAANYRDDDVRTAGVAALRLMGFRVVADRIMYRGKDAPHADVTRPVVIRASTRGTGWYVKAPYKAEASEGFRGIPGRRWEPETKEWFVPWAGKVELWRVLTAFYQGHNLVSPKGTTEIKADEAKVAV
jgi:hypothetical protein